MCMISIPVKKLNAQVINNCNKWLKSYLKTMPHQELQVTPYTNRKTISFGHDYFKLAENDRTFTEIPEYLLQLCKELVESFSAQYKLPNYKKFTNVIISIYNKGYKLEPHVDVSHLNMTVGDKPVNFYFGEHVLGVILKADQEGHLYIIQSKNNEKPHSLSPILKIDEITGLGYLLTGQLRYKPYYHGVTSVKNLRISVTYRTVEFV